MNDVFNPFLAVAPNKACLANLVTTLYEMNVFENIWNIDVHQNSTIINSQIFHEFKYYWLVIFKSIRDPGGILKGEIEEWKSFC